MRPSRGLIYLAFLFALLVRARTMATATVTVLHVVTRSAKSADRRNEQKRLPEFHCLNFRNCGDHFVPSQEQQSRAHEKPGKSNKSTTNPTLRATSTVCHHVQKFTVCWRFAQSESNK